MPAIPVEISARHWHPTKASFAKLFGQQAELKMERKLSQADEFSSPRTVTLQVGPNQIKKIRVLGPFRRQDQVEISRSDARHLKIDVPLRVSGHTQGSAPATLIGPAGEISLPEGMIVAQRHLHIDPVTATDLGLKDGQNVSLEVSGSRGGRLGQCVVRIRPGFKPSFHIDTDEGNALGLKGGERGKIIIDE